MSGRAALRFALTVTFVAVAHAEPDYKEVALNAYPLAAAATAQSVYIEDCGVPDSAGKVVCHSCYNELTVRDTGSVRDYADQNLQIIDGNGAPPRVIFMRELAQRIMHITPDETAVERAKSEASFEKALTKMFKEGDQWCEAKGGKRHELKNTIGDVSDEGGVR